MSLNTMTAPDIPAVPESSESLAWSWDAWQIDQILKEPRKYFSSG